MNNQHLPSQQTHDGRFKKGEEAIAIAKRKLPTLTAGGLGAYHGGQHVYSGPEFESKRDTENFSAANVETAIAFLLQCPTKTMTSTTSYGLKHLAEQWGKSNGMQAYVTNGELIAAAAYLGFSVKPFIGGLLRENGYNALIKP